MEIPVGRQRMILHEETAFGSETVEIWGIAGPNAEFKDEMQWTAHYWGDEPEKVITIAIKDQRADSGNLFTLIEALDDRGRPIPLLNEATQEGPNLGLYFKPERDAKSIRLKVAYHPAYWTDFGFVPRTR